MTRWGFLTWATVTAICSSLCLSIIARCCSIIFFGTAQAGKWKILPPMRSNCTHTHTIGMCVFVYVCVCASPHCCISVAGGSGYFLIFSGPSCRNKRQGKRGAGHSDPHLPHLTGRCPFFFERMLESCFLWGIKIRPLVLREVSTSDKSVHRLDGLDESIESSLWGWPALGLRISERR